MLILFIVEKNPLRVSFDYVCYCLADFESVKRLDNHKLNCNVENINLSHLNIDSIILRRGKDKPKLSMVGVSYRFLTCQNLI